MLAVSRTCSDPPGRTLTISSSSRIPPQFAWCLVYKFFPSEGAYIGCDLTGEVVKLGPNLKVDLKVGDRVSVSVAGSEYSADVCLKGNFADLQHPYFLDAVSGRSAFSEYVKMFSDIVWKIPQGTLSFEQAAGTGSPYISHFPSIRSFPRTRSLI
jgi:NADPH:quinone reductase-like Zn-dependent oxidoreductase